MLNRVDGVNIALLVKRLVLNMREIWKDIKGYEGIYQVSNRGNVRSLHYNKLRILTPLSKQGYYSVALSVNSKCKHFPIHRLVAEAFIPNPSNLPEINHKDEDGTNNSVDNLEWCTREYNNNYGSRNKRVSETLKGHAVSEETREKIRQHNYTRDDNWRHAVGKGRRGKPGTFLGKRHSEESKLKMSLSKQKAGA